MPSLAACSAPSGITSDPAPAQRVREGVVEICPRLADEFPADLGDLMQQRRERQFGVGENLPMFDDALIGHDIDQHQRRHLDGAEGVLHQPRNRALTARAVMLRMAGVAALI
jgi:hypothetical protein